MFNDVTLETFNEVFGKDENLLFGGLFDYKNLFFANCPWSQSWSNIRIFRWARWFCCKAMYLLRKSFNLMTFIKVNIYFCCQATLRGTCWSWATNSIQKQPFADVLQNKCSWKFRKFHRKTPVLKSLFNKVAALKACNFIKKRLQHKCFPVNIAKFFKNSLFYRKPLVAASKQHSPWESTDNIISRIP